LSDVFDGGRLALCLFREFLSQLLQVDLADVEDSRFGLVVPGAAARMASLTMRCSSLSKSDTSAMLRSVIRRNVNFAEICRRTFSAKNAIEYDLPLPCVCQKTPSLPRSGCADSASSSNRIDSASSRASTAARA